MEAENRKNFNYPFEVFLSKGKANLPKDSNPTNSPLITGNDGALLRRIFFRIHKNIS